MDLSKPAHPTKLEFKNEIEGLNKSRSMKMMGAVRLLVAAAQDPGTKMSLDGLAKASGLPHWTVKQIMLSPQYADMVGRACASFLPSMQMKILSEIDRRITDGEVTTSQLIQAGRLINESVKTYATKEGLRKDVDSEQVVAALYQECDDIAEQIRAAHNIAHTIIGDEN